MSEWAGAWGLLGVEAPGDELLDRLIREYQSPARAYHTLQHIEECFQQFHLIRSQIEHPAEVILALWFHDAVYDSHRSDNEAMSAEWAVREMTLAGCLDSTAQSARDLILATKHDVQPENDDARYLVDIDLAILGAAPDRFDEYERQVRQEYSWVPEDEFGSARARILRGFLARPSLYITDDFQRRFEARARENLVRSLEHLRTCDFRAV